MFSIAVLEHLLLKKKRCHGIVVFIPICLFPSSCRSVAKDEVTSLNTDLESPWRLLKKIIPGWPHNMQDADHRTFHKGMSHASPVTA